MRALLKTTAIQNELLLNYKMYNLTAEELICLCQMITIDPVHVDLISFLKIAQNSKPLISSLVTKQMITLVDRQGKMTIDLSKLYTKLTSEVEQLNEVGLTTIEIDKLIHIFGRNLNPNEIAKINSWMTAGATFSKIEEAIYVALAKGINNLNYIEKIIVNSNTTTEQVVKKESSIKRNWTY